MQFYITQSVLLLTISAYNCHGQWQWIDRARGRPTRQMNTVAHYPSSIAVNGQDCTGGFTHTENEPYPPWWSVDLEGHYKIREIRITPRNDGNYGGEFSIRVGTGWPSETRNSTLCTRGNVEHSQTSYITCDQETTGRYITLYRHVRNQPLCLCTVTVYAEPCADGYYGVRCNRRCPSCKTCNRLDGRCTSCRTGSWGSRCQNCSEHCSSSSCDFNSGRCSSCKTGYWGSSCNRNCSTNCSRSLCDQDTGRCSSCVSGKWGVTCENTCSIGCNDSNCNFQTGYCSSCKEGKWGLQCQNNCSEGCSDSVCGFTSGDCQNCISGWWGQQCDRNCSVNCDNGACYKDTGTCYRCKNGTYGNLCDISCPANCQGPNCTQENGNCNECKPGYWGARCNNTCGQCKNGSCRQSDGSCPGDCTEGYFDSYCRSRCSSECKDPGSCFKDSGNCLACKTGYYGHFCQRGCPAHCENGCLQNTASCLYNVAFRKRTEQTSTAETYSSDKAVDGNLSSCAVTGRAAAQKWKVYLGGSFLIKNIRIHPGNNQLQENMYRVTVGGTENSSFSGGTHTLCNHVQVKKNSFAEITCIGGHKEGNSIAVEAVTWDGVTKLCEVEVYAECKKNYFGENCDISCPENCKDHQCDRINGTCTEGCERNKQGDYCTEDRS